MGRFSTILQSVRSYVADDMNSFEFIWPANVDTVCCCGGRIYHMFLPCVLRFLPIFRAVWGGNGKATDKADRSVSIFMLAEPRHWGTHNGGNNAHPGYLLSTCFACSACRRSKDQKCEHAGSGGTLMNWFFWFFKALHFWWRSDEPSGTPKNQGLRTELRLRMKTGGGHTYLKDGCPGVWAKTLGKSHIWLHSAWFPRRCVWFQPHCERQSLHPNASQMFSVNHVFMQGFSRQHAPWRAAASPLLLRTQQPATAALKETHLTNRAVVSSCVKVTQNAYAVSFHLRSKAADKRGLCAHASISSLQEKWVANEQAMVYISKFLNVVSEQLFAPWDFVSQHNLQLQGRREAAHICFVQSSKCELEFHKVVPEKNHSVQLLFSPPSKGKHDDGEKMPCCEMWTLLGE